jgi:hypothetical protein
MALGSAGSNVARGILIGLVAALAGEPRQQFLAQFSGRIPGRRTAGRNSAIARKCVNGLHFLHIYSYVGIDHLHPGKTHPAADQSVSIMKSIPVEGWVVNVIGDFLGRRGPPDPLAVRRTRSAGWSGRGARRAIGREGHC